MSLSVITEELNITALRLFSQTSVDLPPHSSWCHQNSMMSHLDRSTALPAVWSMRCGKSVYFHPLCFHMRAMSHSAAAKASPIWLIAASFFAFSNWTCHLQPFQLSVSSVPSLPLMSSCTRIWGNTKCDIKQITSSWKRVPASTRTPLGQAGGCTSIKATAAKAGWQERENALHSNGACFLTTQLSDGAKLPQEWQISHKSTGGQENGEDEEAIFIWLQFFSFCYGFSSCNLMKQWNPDK